MNEINNKVEVVEAKSYQQIIKELEQRLIEVEKRLTTIESRMKMKIEQDPLNSFPKTTELFEPPSFNFSKLGY
jgi:hypothetical protein